MQIKNHTITCRFKLIETYEVDIEFSEDSFSLRIELFNSLDDKKKFRYKVWRNELFRIQSTFPQNNEGEPMHKSSDEMIMIQFSAKYLKDGEIFHANNTEDALNKILKDISKSINFITG